MRDLRFGSCFVSFFSLGGKGIRYVFFFARAARLDKSRFLREVRKLCAGGQKERRLKGEHTIPRTKEKKERKVWLYQMDLLTLRF